MVKRFIHEKIKVVYKNIYKFKGTSRLKDLDIDSVEKEAEDWANAQEQQLQQLKIDENYRREFIGNVSHELRTPISVLSATAETILTLEDNQKKIPKRVKKYFLGKFNSSFSKYKDVYFVTAFVPQI